ncbi:MAG TPA: hypothetical protein VGF55_07985 [Gemmataceae bacterium]|jgi:hypothetical protein
MRSDDLLNYVRDVPFRPFRITMNSGRTYDIRHPEMIRVGRTSANVFLPRPGDPPDAPYDRFDMVSLVLIERVEHIEAPAAA